jgi:hypothetical protein
LVTALDTISKILGKQIFPKQLMKKISKVEWGLLSVRHCLVEAQVEESKMAYCVFYWVPNLPLLQEMMIASAIIEDKSEDSITFSNYVNAHIFGRGIDRGGDDLIDMTRYINREKETPGSGAFQWLFWKMVRKNMTIIKRKEQGLRKAARWEVPPFDICLVNAKKSVEDARCIMIRFTADSVPGFEPRHLEVSTSMLPDHFIYSDPALLEDDFCDVAKFSRAEDREDADSVHLDPAMLIGHVGGGFGLELKMRMVKFEKTVNFSYDNEDATPDLEEGFIGCIIFCGEAELYTFRFSAAMSV